MCLLSWLMFSKIIYIGSRFYSVPPFTHACDTQTLIFVQFFIQVFKIFYHPNLLFSLVNIPNILFYNILTNTCDLEVKVMYLDIFI